MTFINPYNFASLGEKRSDAPVREGKLLSGYLECRLTTLSPLFIPNTTNNRVFTGGTPGHSSYEFFSYDDLKGKNPSPDGYQPEHPVIPGSSLRGALRSVYEALTNSCLSTLTDFPLHSRVPNVRKAGLLFCREENGQEVWFLQPAKRYSIRTRVDDKRWEEAPGPDVWIKKKNPCSRSPWTISLPSHPCYKNLTTGDVICFDAGKDRNYGKGNLRGVLLLGEDFGSRMEGNVLTPGKKKGDHLFVAVDDALPVSISPQDIRCLEIVLAEYRNTKTNKHTTYNAYNRPFPHNQFWGYSLDLAKKNQGLPVFYDEIGDGSDTHYYLSPACLSRSVYFNTLTQIAKANGNYQPCSDPKNLCPACALFGMVGEKGALGSRVRFGDAQAERVSFMKPVTLPELLNPHVTAMELYTEAKPDTYKTYDYQTTYKSVVSVDQQGFRHTEKIPVHTLFQEKGLPRLRGRKMYWHGKNKTMEQALNKSDLNSTVRPVAAHSTFMFNVYYNEISEAELRQLVALLMLKPRLAHKLGRAKPLGFGSLSIQVTRAVARSLDIKDGIRYQMLFPKTALSVWKKDIRGNLIPNEIDFQQAFSATNTRKGFLDALTMLTVDHLGANKVAYPGFRFFAKNRGSLLAPQYIHVLPDAQAQNLRLPLAPNPANNRTGGRPNQQYGNRDPGRR